MKKYYDMLGLPETASITEITNAYRKRLKVVHPDRFDLRTQPEEWGQANRMLQELNDAYTRLKEFHRKSGVSNGSTRSSYSEQNTRKESRREEESQQKSSQTEDKYDFYSTVRRGMHKFTADKATSDVKLFLQKLHKEENVLKLFSSRILLHFFGAIGCLTLFYSLCVAYSGGSFALSGSFFIILLLLASGGGGGYLLIQFLKFFTCPIRPYSYFTPVYFIHVDPSGVVEYCYLWELYKIVHHREKFTRYFNIHYCGRMKVAHLLPWFGLNKFMKKFDELNNYRYTVEQGPEWLFENDILNKQKLDYVKKFIPASNLAYGFLALCMFMILSYVIPTGHEIMKENAAKSLENYSNREQAASNSAEQSTQPNTVAKTFNKPEVPFPMNGEEFQYVKSKAIAPLEIAVPSGDEYYFVKIVDESSNKPVKAVFIYPGERITIRVPLGRFRLRYATGQQWYGRRYLFGPATNLSEADQGFDFEFQGNQVSGYTVELIKQQNGNLHTKQISLDNF